MRAACLGHANLSTTSVYLKANRFTLDKVDTGDKARVIPEFGVQRCYGMPVTSSARGASAPRPNVARG